MRNKVIDIKRIVTLFAVVFAMVLSIFALNVNADGKITVFILPDKDNAGNGDIIKVNVVADNMPGVSKFGPIEIKYDSDLVDFISVEMGEELNGFVNTTTQGEGSVIVSAVDQAAGSEGTEGDYDLSVFTSDKNVVLFSLYVRVKPQITGVIPFSIESIGDFLHSSDEKINTTIGSGANVSVIEGVSNDASITFLRLSGVNLNPAFSKNKTQYVADVDKSVTEIPISVTPSNSGAAVVINGNQNLQIGENIITIDVTAQDGTSHMKYEIVINRKESYLPENALIIDREGVTYTFVDLPSSLNLPEGFIQTSKVLNGYTVPAFTKEGISSLLLYLFDGNNTPNLYFYNQTAKTVIPYNPETTIMRPSKVLNMVYLEDSEVPKNFKKATFEDENGTVYFGYEDDEGQFICLMVDEIGDMDFYLLDKAESEFYRYKPVDKSAEVIYSSFFYIFFFISVLEAIILIVIIYVVRKIILDKTNPRPRRV